MEFANTPDFWLGLLMIIWIDIILSGDNAVVIALATRNLPAHQQKKAIIFGAGAAVGLRVALAVVASLLMDLYFIQIIGGLMLLWIGTQLLEGEDDEANINSEHGSMFAAIRTILIADFVMSLDNVIAVAAAAKGDELLLVIGLAISIPLVIFGSTLMLKLMERFPFIVTLGALLIGWIGGGTISNDVFLREFSNANPWFHYTAAAAGALFVLAWDRVSKARKAKEEEPTAE
jgi:YjbE family integral membrane protein